MSEPKLISPMLDNFIMGDPISDRNGVRCCPAIDGNTQNRYIVKIISTPASQRQLDALLLSGAYSDQEAASAYFESLAEGISQEVQILQNLSQLEGFMPVNSCQIVPMEGECGFDVYLLSEYRNTLDQYFRREAMTHLGAINLGLDLCSALAVCRRSGYLYVNLKPNNVYITPQNSYQIGDIGFLKLDSLKYASLPDRYRSQYTAPEIADAMSALNTTIDVYAVGLILYQAFNDGTLPFRSDSAPTESFPPPAYADYEMAEIILKACAPDSAQRYQDPVEMGQALVSYMQRNGAHDTPIAPPAIPDSEESANESNELTEEIISEEVSKITESTEETVDSKTEQIDSSDVPEDLYTENEEGNLTFFSDSDYDETAPDPETSDIDYEEVSDEVSEILTQADDLLAHPTPEPVIQPEPIDVPLPPPILPDIDEANKEDANTESDTEVSAENQEEIICENNECSDSNEMEVESNDKSDTDADNKPSHWLRNVLLVFIGAAILVAGFFFYKNYYLQPIEAILLEEHSNGDLTVLVSSQVDESKLTVVCSDTYGNQLTSPVENGKASFTGLTPDSAYTVKVLINGFHRLTGDTSAAFTTPVQTNIVQFQAVTGSEDGSVVLNFTIDGPDAEKWKIRYQADGVDAQEISFSGHMATLTGLNIGTEYSFVLTPENDLHVTGTTEIVYTPSTIVKAVDLSITGCLDDILTAVWSAPDGITVESWTVRCYNESGFDETIVVTEPNASFEGVDPSSSYTVEVTAAGMSVSERAYAAANSTTVTDFKADDADPNNITLTWNIHGSAPEGGWILLYTMNNSAVHEIACERGNTITITEKIPGIKYAFTLQTANGNAVLGGKLSFETHDAQTFTGYGVTAKQMEFKMCKTPKNKNWDRYDLSKSDYTTTFSAGEKASFLVRLRSEYSTSSDKITTLFVIRDENGMIISTGSTMQTWRKMWYRNYCELDVPSIPQAAGKYTISIYFNGALAAEQSFEITT